MAHAPDDRDSAQHRRACPRRDRLRYLPLVSLILGFARLIVELRQ
jgi:hypothetical protein